MKKIETPIEIDGKTFYRVWEIQQFYGVSYDTLLKYAANDRLDELKNAKRFLPVNEREPFKFNGKWYSSFSDAARKENTTRYLVRKHVEAGITDRIVYTQSVTWPVTMFGREFANAEEIRKHSGWSLTTVYKMIRKYHNK